MVAREFELIQKNSADDTSVGALHEGQLLFTYPGFPHPKHEIKDDSRDTDCEDVGLAFVAFSAGVIAGLFCFVFNLRHSSLE